MLVLMPAEMLRLTGEFQRFAKIFRLTFMESSAIKKKKKGKWFKGKGASEVPAYPRSVLFVFNSMCCVYQGGAVYQIK